MYQMKGVNKMKNFFASLVFIGIIFLAGLLNNYSMSGYVASAEDGVITLVDEMGEAWEYETDDFEVGDNVKIIWCDFETMSRTDDAIVKIKKVRE